MIDFKRVTLEVYGFTEAAVIVRVGNEYPSIPMAQTYINDPEDERDCVLMNASDSEMQQRCIFASFVTGWVPDWIINGAGIKPYVEPAKPSAM